MLRRLIIVSLSALLLACSSGVRQEEEKNNIADTNMRLGLGYLKQGRLDDALAKLEKALDEAPDMAEAHSTVALIYKQLGEKEQADKHFSKALDLKPEDGATHNNYGVFLCEQRQFDKAEKHFMQALQSRGYKTPASAWENAGVCAEQIPDIDKAEKYLRKALQINPRQPVALFEMARICFDTNRTLNARAYMERYFEVEKPGPQSLWLIIRVERKLGANDLADKYADQLRRKFPDADETRQLQIMEQQ